MDNTDVIKRTFKNATPRHSKYIRYGIITEDKELAKELISKLYERNIDKCLRYINSQHGILLDLYDGTRYQWIRPMDNSRGYRCSKAFIDKRIDIEILNNIVFPLCVYCGKDDITII